MALKNTKSLYDGRDSLGSFLSVWRIKRVLPYIKGELLDLSCGDNRLVHVYGSGKGVDVNDYGADIVLDTFLKLPFDTASLDTITIIGSFNYFDEPETTLSEIYRVLKNDGQLVLTMPNLIVMRIWHKFREPWAKLPGFSEKGIRTMAEKSGFSISLKKKFMLGINNIYILNKL